MSKPFELTVSEATNNVKFHLPSGGVVRHGRWTLATDADATHPYIKQHIDLGIIGIREVATDGELVEIVPVAPEPVVEPVVEVAPEPVIETIAEPEPVVEVAPEPVIETIAEPEPVPEPVVEVAPEPVVEPVKAAVKKGPKAAN